VGDDNKIFAFDYLNRKLKDEAEVHAEGKHLKKAKVVASSLSEYHGNDQGRAIAYNKHNSHVAVSNNLGEVTIRTKDSLKTVLKTLKDQKEWSEVIKYSPCGKYLTVGSHDNFIYIYDVSQDYNLNAKFDKHNSFITAFDWSADSTYIRSICGAYEKLYYNVSNKEFDNNGMQNTKSFIWATNSIKKGWDVEGTRPISEDGTHINSIDVSQDQKLIATSDDFGLLNIYRYPCMSVKHKARSYSGHSEHVVRARFTPQADRIFTIGGYDKAVI
jgi:echinoderm microtubule-associated protein-like 1/2